jgi:sphinganine C4-monooxygenase
VIRIVMDAWEYALHRYFHENRFLYKHFHSKHHRLNAPYAFGAMYGSPVEGCVIDGLGGIVAGAAARLSVPQTALFFGAAMLKTVDDHCGYALPCNPLRLVFANGADYHDIHHQVRRLAHLARVAC